MRQEREENSLLVTPETEIDPSESSQVYWFPVVTFIALSGAGGISNFQSLFNDSDTSEVEGKTLCCRIEHKNSLVGILKWRIRHTWIQL